MRISTIIVVLIFLISAFDTKPVTHVDLEDFFKEWPIESSTDKHYFRAPAWTGGCQKFVFKVYKPHPEFDLEFKFNEVGKNSTDDDIVNSEKWTSIRLYAESHSWEDYDIYYYHQNFPIGYEGDLGIYFSSDKKYKMDFAVRANGYIFQISAFEEKIVEDFAYTHYFKTDIVGEGTKDMSFVVKVYKPMELYDFSVYGKADYGVEGKSPEKLNFRNFNIKEGDDYVKFSYPFHIGEDIKSVTFDFSSLAHYKIGFYVVYE